MAVNTLFLHKTWIQNFLSNKS